jgi:hypothetical protein
MYCDQGMSSLAEFLVYTDHPHQYQQVGLPAPMGPKATWTVRAGFCGIVFLYALSYTLLSKQTFSPCPTYLMFD